MLHQTYVCIEYNLPEMPFWKSSQDIYPVQFQPLHMFCVAYEQCHQNKSARVPIGESYRAMCLVSSLN